MGRETTKMDGVYFQNEAVQRDGSAAAAAVRTAPADFSAQWERIAQRLRSNLGEDLYSSWFARMDIEQFQDGRLVVSLPTRFLRNWIVSHYSDTLAHACEAELGSITALCVQVRTRGLPVRALPQERPQQAFATAGRAPTRDIAQRHDPSDQAFGGYRDRSGSDRSGDRSGDRGSPLDLRQTFETFVVGGSNRAGPCRGHARRRGAEPASRSASIRCSSIPLPASARRICSMPSPGACASAARTAMCCSSPPSASCIISSARSQGSAIRIGFKDYFQSIDVLLIDDFQFLQGKTMQQEFYHTFNSLVDSKRQVIIAADVPPAQLDTHRPAHALASDGRPRGRYRIAGSRAAPRDSRRSGSPMPGARTPAVPASPTMCSNSSPTRFTGGGRELEGALNRVIAHHAVEPLAGDARSGRHGAARHGARPRSVPRQDRRHPQGDRPPLQCAARRSPVAAPCPSSWCRARSACISPRS